MSTTREPLFNFSILTNANTTFDWLFKTNQLIQGMNTLYVADVVEGDGICLARNSGIVQINIDPGPGLGFTPSKDLTLNFSGVTEASSSTLASPAQANDFFVVERGSSLRKIKANSILPTTVLHNHTFEGNINFSNNINIKPNENVFQDNRRWTASINTGTQGSLVYEGYNSLWSFNNNLNLGTSNRNAIISKNTQPGIIADSLESVFNFCTSNILGTNANTDGDDILPTSLSFDFNVGSAPTDWDRGGVGFVNNIWPATWKLKFNTNSASFYHYDSTTSDNNQELFSIQKLGVNNNLVHINGKILINDIQNSTQFINSPTGAANRVPLTTVNGLLDKKFTNRIVTTDFSEILDIGSLVVVGLHTDGDTEYELGIANGIGNSDVIGIVEKLDAGVATIVLSGEFDLLNGNLQPGSKYFLSQTQPGNYVVENTYSSGILRPVFVAVSETKGVLIPSSSAITTSIGSITVNYGAQKEETLQIDSQNYPLKFVAGPNIEFDVTSNDEISIRVVDLAGAQDTFKTINLDGVGTTDGDDSVIATLPNQELTLKSNTLGIFGNDITKTIQIEAPNAFKFFRFIDSNSEIVYSAENTNDTLNFVAGTGIDFQHNTDDSIIITASVLGGVNPSNINFSGPYQLIVSDQLNQGSTLSLLGGSANSFDANWSIVNEISTPILDPLKPMSYSGNYEWNYDGQIYTIHSSYGSVAGMYVADSLAGYVLGRITPSAGQFPGTTYASDKITKLTRRDLRFFLGINPIGYIDNINNLFNSWKIVKQSETEDDLPPVSAASKIGVIQYAAGPGIRLGVEEVNYGVPTLVIENTGVPQNAFSSITIKNNNNEVLDSITATTSSDFFTLKSGRFVKLSSDTNIDTVVFDISISDDYVILGNPGTTDGMDVIDLSQESSCLVGRSGAEIRAITAEDLSWGATNLNTPLMELPYFGMIAVDSGQSGDTFINANSSGYLRLVQGTNVNLSVVGNEITINASGTGESIPQPTIRNIFVNNDVYNVTLNNAPTPFFKLKFLSGAQVSVSTTGLDAETQGILPIIFSLTPINGFSILANTANVNQAPQELIFETNNTVLARINNTLDAWPIKDQTSTSTTIKNNLDIRHYNTVNIVNSTGQTTQAFTALPAAARLGAALKFTAGNNISLTTVGTANDTLLVALNSTDLLLSDQNAIFYAKNTPKYHCNIKYGKDSLHNSGEEFILHEVAGLQKTALQFTPDPPTPPEEPEVTSFSNYFITKEFTKTTNINLSGNDVVPILSETGISTYFNEGTTTREYIYSSSHILKVSDKTGSDEWTRGDLKLETDVCNIDCSSSLIFSGSGSEIFFGSGSNKYLRANNNFFRFRHSSASSSTFNPQITLAAYDAQNLTAISARFRINSKDNFDINLLPATQGSNIQQSIGLSITKTYLDGPDRTYTTISPLVGGSGWIRFEGSLDFQSATVYNLAIPNHNLTHQSVQSVAANGAILPGTDPLYAWQVGAVSRLQPVFNNRIGLTNDDGYFDYDTNAYTLAELYGSGGTASDYNTIFDGTKSTSNVGPMYVVLNTGEEVSLGSESTPQGPPGQIIMIKA